MAVAVSLSPVQNHTHPPAVPCVVRDPVCGMSVEPTTAQHRSVHAGRSYFFCSAGCRERVSPLVTKLCLLCSGSSRAVCPNAPTSFAGKVKG
jgi:YHS domain-containing protein